MSTNYDKIYIVTSITHLIPLKLDLPKLNYAYWSELFTTHFNGFNVLKFIKGTSTSEEQATDEWMKADVVVRTRIYLTISKTLRERLLKLQPKTAFEVWTHLQKIFLDNKRTKSTELLAELRALELGSLTVDEYFRKIDSISTLLNNLGSTVNEYDLVMYAINGLGDKFSQLSSIMLHRETFPNLETFRSMVRLEEIQMKRKKSFIVTPPTPLSPSVLLAHTLATTQVCRNFSCGSCKFGAKCRYLHSEIIQSITDSSRQVTKSLSS
ncbi:uncharacterized protein [Rutidosis leptorrhynchoides]|uniref:uncharacterized protein n=1 Tax=Rutidosis leptorrhynchoides TaxID=125765 RepID=UPI003A99F5A5